MAPQLAAALHRLEAEILNTNEGGVVGMHHVDFWLNICICHSLIVERGPTGELIYQVRCPGLQFGAAGRLLSCVLCFQGPSPDEVALVEAGKQLGYVFKHRDANNVYLDFQGVDLQFQLLNVIDFSSERKRMSVVVKCPDGTVRLFCKGADNAILDRLSPGQEADFMELTDRNLRMFAQQGLRTLCLGTKVVQAGAYRDWDERFQAATALIDGREEQMSKLQDEVERDLELVGVTAIEDKLQDGVPEAIATLLEAGVKVWMITGDKQETAINIATSCRLLKKSEGAMICNSDSYLAARYRLRELLDIVDPGNAIKRAACATPAGSLSTPPPELDNFLGGASGAKRDHELVIDGHTLTHILGTNLESSLSELASHCSGVVVCRASPSQKACIVKLMKDYECKQAIGNARGIEAWRRKFEKKVGPTPESCSALCS